MRRFKVRGRGRLLVIGASALLLADTFLPWQSVTTGGSSYSWNAWHGDKGVPLGLLAGTLWIWTIMLALGLARPAPRLQASITLAFAALIIAFAAVKNIRDDDSAWASYAGVLLAAAVVAGAWLVYRQATAVPPANAGLTTLGSEPA